jgi:2-oxoglutarate ferredoxin oxidoreductase subunit delta
MLEFFRDELNFNRWLGEEGIQMTKHAANKGERELKAKPSGRHSARAEAHQSRGTQKTKKAFEIDIFMGSCTSCGICAAFCPRECIGKDENGSPVVEDSNRCTGCGWCESHCPDFAISVRPRNDEIVTPGEE